MMSSFHTVSTKKNKIFSWHT